jgi:hydroxypyruvate reductase
MHPRELLIDSFRAALTAADPLNIVPRHLPAPPPGGRTIVVGAGKAAAAMAKAVEQQWPEDQPLDGMVITRYAHGYSGQEALKRIRVVEAGHPVPDAAGENAARDILDLVRGARESDLVLALVSGGGSSLLSLPADGISMADLKSVTRDLLACGAPIQEMNVVRKHLSAIQGGRLAAATSARVCALIISDVTGDDPASIASGPTAPDPSTFQDALDILNTYRITPPISVARRLSNGARGDVAETIKPGDATFARVENKVIATAHASLCMAAAFFQQRGVTPMILGDSVTGEAREVAKVYAALARQIRAHHHPLKPPVALISGGECTVTLGPNHQGRGGRCSEFLLSLAIDLNGLEGVHALACDTDGIDGSENNAGAYLSPDAILRAAKHDVHARHQLAMNDAYGFFAALNDLVVTGPTRTNVNDYRVILVA